MTNLWAQIGALPHRSGPRTTASDPHQQLGQNAPPQVPEAIFARARVLPEVSVALLHATLPPDVAAIAIEKGWAEPHPVVCKEPA